MAETQSLFRIEQALANLIAAREECETEEGRAEFTTQIREYVAAEIRKVDGIAEYRNGLKAGIAEVTSELQRLGELLKTRERRLAAIDEATLYAMVRLLRSISTTASTETKPSPS